MVCFALLCLHMHTKCAAHPLKCARRIAGTHTCAHTHTHAYTRTRTHTHASKHAHPHAPGAQVLAAALHDGVPPPRDDASLQQGSAARAGREGGNHGALQACVLEAARAKSDGGTRKGRNRAGAYVWPPKPAPCCTALKCLCVYVCVYVCVRAFGAQLPQAHSQPSSCQHLSAFAHVWGWIHQTKRKYTCAHMQAHTRLCVHTCTHKHSHSQIQGWKIPATLRSHTHMQVHTHTHVRAHTNVRGHTHTHTRESTHSHMHERIYLLTNTHTYTHTHT